MLRSQRTRVLAFQIACCCDGKFAVTNNPSLAHTGLLTNYVLTLRLIWLDVASRQNQECLDLTTSRTP